MRYIFILFILLAGCIIYIGLQSSMNKPTVSKDSLPIPGKVYYMPLGDSYTAGTNELTELSFPAQLIQRLENEGVDISLVATPAVSGYTTQDLIEYELPEFESSPSNFVTLLIGANDIAFRTDAKIFRANFGEILDRVSAKVPHDRIIVLTIPDFSLTPVGRYYQDKTIKETIITFNTLVREEAEKREIEVVDLFSVSQAVSTDPSLISNDGLHPTGKQYTQWVDAILPVSLHLLKDTN